MSYSRAKELIKRELAFRMSFSSSSGPWCARQALPEACRLAQREGSEQLREGALRLAPLVTKSI